jgi:uncharacterized membrane protein SirB2
VLAEHYLLVRAVHVAAVSISVPLLVVRAVIGIRTSPERVPRVLRILPHIVDTALLTSAVLLSVILQQYPFVAPWITAKVLALVAYVGIGTVAVKRGRTPRARSIALVLAVIVAGYIVLTALYHDPAPWRW